MHKLIGLKQPMHLNLIRKIKLSSFQQEKSILQPYFDKQKTQN